VSVVPSLPEEGVDLPHLVSEFERQLIDQALERTEGNRGAAARLLNLKRTTLVEKLKRLGREVAAEAVV
jgi:DNA-binding NtrC family response regulator